MITTAPYIVGNHRTIGMSYSRKHAGPKPRVMV